MTPDRPIIRVQISGLRGSGKSVLAAYFRGLIDDFDIPFTGPEGLPRRTDPELGAAVVNLRVRGLSVEFIETQTGVSPQVDARPGPRRPLRGDAARARVMERVR